MTENPYEIFALRVMELADRAETLEGKMKILDMGQMQIDKMRTQPENADAADQLGKVMENLADAIKKVADTTGEMERQRTIRHAVDKI